ncbi:MAG: ubiquinone/menaquinone biosynthesis methyltransferase [Gemmatimonadaceae bacterium]|nr:ubiquinone/menaquinone biosynthesis methyltransferase [Gemmatimonadaceae bacterium]
MALVAKPGDPGPNADRTPVPRLGDRDLEAHLRDPARKQSFVTPMFDVIAPRYDAFTRLFSFGMDAGWKRAAIAAAAQQTTTRTVLDLASGTGDLAVGIARALPTAQVTALDASTRMIDMANARLATRDADVASRVRTMVGDMTALAFPDASIDLVTAGYGVRNVPDAARALGEIRRVLRPGGRVVLLDFYRPEPALWRALFLTYLQVAGNIVGWWWHRDPVVYGYIARSIDHFMSWQQCSALLSQNGFRVVRVTRHLGGGVARHEAVAV